MTSLIDKFKKTETQTNVKDESRVKSVKVKKADKNNNTASVSAYKFLVKPLVSEKGAIQQVDSKYFFVVDRNANKIQIKKAIESIYGVSVTSVNVINQSGKAVSFGRRSGFRKSWKKAIITLKKGERITTIESV